MSLTYFKRFRMEIHLEGRDFSSPLPDDYRMVAWDPSLVEVHAETKYLCFRSEIDVDLFPCLGERAGCLRLMDEICHKHGFLPEATWLLEYIGAGPEKREYCGTVQGIRVEGGYGGIQNLGITPHHRCRGLAKLLMAQALAGFYFAGLSRAYLEVTARNAHAIRLYKRMGFSKARTLYKAVDGACT